MDKEEKRLKRNKYMKEWRLANPEKVRASQKKTDSNPKRLESKRKRMAKWREENPDKQKEIANRSYRNCFEKNRHKINEKGRNKWNNNEQHRANVLKKAAESYQKNRELFCVDCNRELPKNKSKYCQNCTDKNYKIKSKEWVVKVGREYLNGLQNKRVKKKVDELTDG